MLAQALLCLARPALARRGEAWVSFFNEEQSKMVDVESCPIDYDAAEVGDVVPVGLITTLSGFRPGTTKYSAFQADLAGEIERELWSRGKPFVIRKRRSTLVILEHAEAVDFTRKEVRRGVRKLIRNNERMQHIDRGQLDDKHRAMHDRALVVSGAVVAGFLDSPIVRRVACKRATPGLESWPAPTPDRAA